MVAAPDQVPTKQRRGIPNEKYRLILKKVPEGYVPRTAMERTIAIIKAMSQTDQLAKFGTHTDAQLSAIAALLITQFRKAGDWVVGTAENSARNGEQLDVLLTKPSFL